MINRPNVTPTVVFVLILALVIGVIWLMAGRGGSLSINNSPTGTDTLKIGDAAPDFSLPSQGPTVALSQYQNRPVLLYFNEGVNCGTCWQQIEQLEKDQAFMGMDIPLLTIAPDSAADWQPIIAQTGLKSPILADTDLSVSRMYGMLGMMSSMHRGALPGHSFMLLDKEHRIRWIGDYPNMHLDTDDLNATIKRTLGL